MRGSKSLAHAAGRAAVVLGVAALGTVAVAAPASATRARAAADLDRVTWTRSASEPPGSGNLAGLATNGKRFVATGLAIAPVAGFVPIWTSKDGVKWAPAKGEKAAFPSGTAVNAVVYAHGRFTAFGAQQGGQTVLAWTSTDGTKWKGYDPKGFPPAAGIPVGVAPTKKGLLLQVLEGTQAYHLWSSSRDKWKSLGDVPGIPNAFVASVVPGGKSAPFVAAGRTTDVAAWTSKTGATWTQASLAGPNPADYESINKVIPGGPGFVAVGVVNSAAGSEVAYAWSSKDGKQWQSKESPSFAATSDSSSGMDAASAAGKGVLAAGHDGGALALWASPNGTSWKRAPDDPVFHVRSGTIAQGVGIVSTKGRVVAIFRERSYNVTQQRFVLNGLGIVTGKLGKG